MVSGLADLSGGLTLARAVIRVVPDTKGLEGGLGRAVRSLRRIIPVAGAVSAAFTGLAFAASSTGDRIDKMSQQIGISRRAFQELDFVTSQTGINMNAIAAASRTLVSRLDDVERSGASPAAIAIDKLGIALKDSSGELRTQEALLFDTIRALQGMENITERNNAAYEVFGGQASILNPLLNLQAGEFDNLRNAAHEYGLVLGNEGIDAAVRFTDSVDILRRQFGTLFVELGTEFLPILQNQVIPFLQNVVIPSFRAFANVLGAVASASNAISGVFGGGDGGAPAGIETTRENQIEARRVNAIR